MADALPTVARDRRLFTRGELKAHARALAEADVVDGAGGRDVLRARLKQNETVLVAAFRVLETSARERLRLVPAAVWILDNFYLIEEQVRLAGRHLPRSYSRELPVLREGPHAGFPRVYALALELASHTDGRIDLETLASFLEGYQEVAPLCIGEIWAVPIMLRFALVESLRHIAAKIVAAGIDRRAAAYWADRVAEAADKGSRGMLLAVAELAQTSPRLSVSFVTELARRLQAQFPVQALPMTWLEQQLSEQGLTLEGQFHAERVNESADQLSVSNHIGSLRFLGATDWRTFVESASLLERVLREDPAEVHQSMDFATRDRYRHAVERLARRAAVAEVTVAEKALALAREDGSHIGRFLVGDGRDRLEDAVAGAPGLGRRALRALRRQKLASFLGLVGLITAKVFALVAASGAFAGLAWPLALVLGLALGLVASQLGLSLANWIATLASRPERLPRLDLRGGIPTSLRTAVVVPTMLSSEETLAELVRALEIRALANRDPNLAFVLLTDFPDADTETRDGDAPLLAKAVAAIDALNAHGGAGPAFLLCHRPRRWNAAEGRWMAWERKRGKLIEFARLLRGGPRERFSVIAGDEGRLSGVRYVITLDSDTQLPRDAARQLVAAMAHPLNRPRLDAEKRRVVDGYAILQPRVAIDLSSLGTSRFSQIFAGDAGVDPYTRETSDVYQDLFAEGSFIGKGILDVDAFLTTLDGVLPENSILSHDLIEGGYARAGLVSDVVLYEDFPARYRSDTSRRHRWIRGDWQIAGWLWPRVRDESGRLRPNPLSGLSRWKIADNLRRSVVAPAAVVAAAVAWLTGAAPGAISAVILAMAYLPALLSTVTALIAIDRERPWRLHLADVAKHLGQHLLQATIQLALLPYDAIVSVDAITRVAVRMLVTRRALLEWNTAHEVERHVRGDFATHLATIGVVTVASALVLGWLAATGSQALAVAAPFLVLWIFSPLLAWWISRPLPAETARLGAADRDFLERVARRTWRYFETFVTPADNFLPPDNYQAEPAPQLARRTSPTNVGLGLLSALTAYDFGFLTARELATRVGATLASLAKLERYRGHFLNWYDTGSLEPLWPRYVSTVDSGNLVGSLVLLAAGLDEIRRGRRAPRSLLDGARTTLACVRDELAGAAPEVNGHVDRIAAALASGARDAAESASLALAAAATGSAAHGWTVALLEAIQRLAEPERTTPDVDETLAELAARARELSQADFTFLFDSERRLFSIGFTIDQHRLDAGRYDLLASEARLASFLAIARDQVPEEHWFALGRLLTRVDGESVLMSWSGSMFEYLMPLLFMPEHTDTLLGRTARASVAVQRAYGEARGVPWGISESGYLATDANLTYQYRAFGVPGLGFKRGLADDLVIAPYASVLALTVAPESATANLRRLAADGYLGTLGFYEAIDYTRTRLAPRQERHVIRSYMAHHQGMSMMALSYALLDRPMHRRFLADPELQATELLLQERAPRAASRSYEHADSGDFAEMEPVAPQLRVVHEPAPAHPEVHLLSNGRYHVMVTSDGCGVSIKDHAQITRWRPEPSSSAYGLFLYLRDLDDGAVWCNSHRPLQTAADRYEAIFSEGRAEFRRVDHGIETHTQIAVADGDDLEIRRVTLTNREDRPRRVELTSYAEVAMAPQAADEAHAAFSKLFVETESLGEDGLLLSRRPRTEHERRTWAWHGLAVRRAAAGPVSYETDRAAFLGRRHDAGDPAALRGALVGRFGPVLDPVMAARRTLTIPPHGSVVVDLLLGVAAEREEAVAAMQRYAEPSVADRVFDLAWTHGQIILQQLNVNAATAQLFNKLAGFMIFPHPAMRPPPAQLAQNKKPQSALWGYGISGDLPILLLRVADHQHTELLRLTIAAHLYWKRRGFAADLVIWNEDDSSYRQHLHEQILNLVSVMGESQSLDQRGGIFVRRAAQMPDEDRALFLAAAHVVLSDKAGDLAAQIQRVLREEPRSPLLTPAEKATPTAQETRPVGHGGELVLANGHGGFTQDGAAYRVHVDPKRPTPMPWSNVVANQRCGFVVSEAGSSYTWVDNAHEFRLTPWSNDPVSDPTGEALYLRDEATGAYWSATPAPAGGEQAYTATHGFGYSRFEHARHGIESDLHLFVAQSEPVKISLLRLRNTSAKPRRLSVTGVVSWVLGELRTKTCAHVAPEADRALGAILARNAFSIEFGGRVAFFAATPRASGLSADLREAIGREGLWSRPEALSRERLSGRVAAGADPGAALQVDVALAPGETREVAFLLGAGHDAAQARDLVRLFGVPGRAAAELLTVTGQWNELTTKLKVETPDPAIDRLVNGWLLYQTLSCRVFGRSGFYQSGGAYGFRDQLQDMLAAVDVAPNLAREHIVRCAGRQFREGDVQHWWHPPSGRGVRTRFSDDYLWLPLVVAAYVRATGDRAVLDEMVPFLDGRELRDGEEAYYDLPAVSTEHATVYEHCVRALRYGFKYGRNGLPLMGAGDWNDGMNMVGIEGRGESVWLAFFLHEVLRQFEPLAAARGDAETVASCMNERARLSRNVDASAWDGAWYVRAFYDDGAAMGSGRNAECQIDLLPQAWSVISGAAAPDRAARAMEAVAERLVDRQAGLVQLFDPPFDKAPENPGYIKGYVPGVRENGGQYTHAAIWAIWAFAALGDADRAWELMDLVNPLNHARDAAGVDVYKVEPYVVAADVYSCSAHRGRGGWTWYTGSAAWLYRLLVERLLGMKREDDVLRLDPCLAPQWDGFKAEYRHEGSVYALTIRRTGTGRGVKRLTLDGREIDGARVPLSPDGGRREVIVETH